MFLNRRRHKNRMFKKVKKLLHVSLIFILMFGLGMSEIYVSAQSNDNSFDTIIRGGTILDGSGLDRYDADVAIKDGYIAKIGDLSEYSATEEINADGLFVAPGFIDIHSHAALASLKEAKSALTQGVTTEILSPDGGGPTDITERFALEKDGLGINIGTYIGFNSVWSEVVGNEDRRATEQEIEEMRNLVSEAMEEGAAGVSAGLFYRPAYFADTDEVIDVVSAARDWRTNFPNHQRNENNEVVEATAETIEIGEESGLVPVITHIKTMGPNNWGKSKEMMQLINDANERGVYTAADIYPYLRSQTGLTAIVPPWVEEGGRSEMLKRFADPELRPVIEKEIEEIMYSRVEGPEGVYFPTKKRTLADYMELGMDDARSRTFFSFLNLNYDHEFDVEVDEIYVKNANGNIVYEYDFEGNDGDDWDSSKFDELHSYPSGALSYSIEDNLGKINVAPRVQGNASAYGKVTPTMPDVGDSETFMRFRVGDTLGKNQIIRVWINSDHFSSGSSFAANGYGIAVRLDQDRIQVQTRENSSTTLHDTITNAGIEPHTWLDLKVKLEDDVLSVKMWPTSEEEPEEWGSSVDVSKDEVIEDQQTLISMSNLDNVENTFYFDELSVQSISGNDVYFNYDFSGSDGDSWNHDKFTDIHSYPDNPVGAAYSIQNNTGQVTLAPLHDDYCCSSYGKLTLNMDDVKNSDTILRFRTDKVGDDQQLRVFTKADKFLSGMAVPVNGYGIELDLKTDTLSLINREDSTTKEIETVDADLDTEWHMLKLRAVDDEVSVRLWKDGEEEPEDWDIVYVEEERELTPGETTMQILETEGSLRTIYDFGHEDDFKRFVQSPVVAIASDGGSTTSDSVHPRRYGSQPRVLGKYVREEGLISWEQAVQKMTSLPATIIGLSDRGYIAAGMKADLTIFNPETVIDRATFDDPKQYAEGIEHVIIDGQLALTNGELTGIQAGKAVKVEPNMPSRPVTLEDLHISDNRAIVSLDGEVQDASIVYDLQQGADDTKAEGTVRIVSEDHSIDLVAEDLGRVQLFDDWISFTGTGILNGEDLTSFRITIDENDPTINDERPVITIDIVGQEQIKALLDEELSNDVDKEELGNKVREIKDANLDETEYTEESWNNLQAALTVADDVLENEEATQAEVDKALSDLIEAFEGLEKITEPDPDPSTIKQMIALVEDFVDEGEIMDEEAARHLQTHLQALEYYEKTGALDKAIRHMHSFKDLLTYQEENDLISEHASQTLSTHADNMIEQWQ